MCVSILPTCPQRSAEGIRLPGTGVMGGCEPPCGCWDLCVRVHVCVLKNVDTEMQWCTCGSQRITPGIDPWVTL